MWNIPEAISVEMHMKTPNSTNYRTYGDPGFHEEYETRGECLHWSVTQAPLDENRIQRSCECGAWGTAPRCQAHAPTKDRQCNSRAHFYTDLGNFCQAHGKQRGLA